VPHLLPDCLPTCRGDLTHRIHNPLHDKTQELLEQRTDVEPGGGPAPGTIWATGGMRRRCSGRHRWTVDRRPLCLCRASRWPRCVSLGDAPRRSLVVMGTLVAQTLLPQS
jgi:hypothetical protein